MEKYDKQFLRKYTFGDSVGFARGYFEDRNIARKEIYSINMRDAIGDMYLVKRSWFKLILLGIWIYYPFKSLFVEFRETYGPLYEEEFNL
eukprot:Mrub_15362.p2 GENE.Mrub_15362~~Mrub_15362.p2  ORF type:complete len:104 (+),score=11.09 Mrub_15362:45-314(+)